MKAGLQYAVNACQNALGWFSNTAGVISSDFFDHQVRMWLSSDWLFQAVVRGIKLKTF